MDKEFKKFRYRNLSWPLQAAVVFAWIWGVCTSLAVLVYFVAALLYI